MGGKPDKNTYFYFLHNKNTLLNCLDAENVGKCEGFHIIFVKTMNQRHDFLSIE